MMMLFRISVQLSVEPSIAHRSATPSTPEQLPVYFYLITWLIQLYCFHKSVCSRKAFYLF